MPAAALPLRGIRKSFGGVPVLKGVDFSVELGEIHALMGENGAGKSTLMKVLAGVYELTSGELIFDGKPLHLKSPAEALAQGIAMVFQETNLVPSMSVAQNIYLGEEQLFNRLRGLYIQAQRFLLSLNFYVDPMALVSTLGAGKKGKRLGDNANSEEARAYFPSPGRTETGSWDWALDGAARGAAGFGAGAAADSFFWRWGIQP